MALRVTPIKISASGSADRKDEMTHTPGGRLSPCLKVVTSDQSPKTLVRF